MNRKVSVRRRFWIVLGAVLWLTLLAEVPAHLRRHPVLQLVVVLCPMAVFWKLRVGVCEGLLRSLAQRIPYAVAGGLAVWGLNTVASSWRPELRDDFGVLTPGFLMEEALYAYPLTWTLLLSLAFWWVRRLGTKQRDRSVFRSHSVLLFLWAWEVTRNYEVWFSASGNQLSFLWLNVAAAVLPFLACLVLLWATLRITSSARVLRPGLSTTFGSWCAVLSVLLASASLIALMERTTTDRLYQELEELRGAAWTCEELKRQPPERAPCRRAE